MTYFELVSTLKELEKNKNKDLYNKIMNPDIALYTDMEFRFSIQVMKFIINKSNEAYTKTLNLIVSTALDLDTFTLTIKDLKSEIDYITTFTKINILGENCSKDLSEVLDKINLSYYNLYIDLLEKAYNEDYINIYKSIMNRNEGKNEL